MNRLDSSSGHVKLKVLKILLYLCSHGSSSFLLILKRNSALIQEATGTWSQHRLAGESQGGMAGRRIVN